MLCCETDENDDSEMDIGEDSTEEEIGKQICAEMVKIVKKESDSDMSDGEFERRRSVMFPKVWELSRVV